MRSSDWRSDVCSADLGGATSPTAAAPLQPRFRHSRAGGNPATSPSAKSGTSALGPRLRGDDGQDKAARRTIAGVSMTHPVLTALGLYDNEQGSSYPPYNVEKHGDDEYRIVVAAAGFQEEDLDLQVEKGVLTISGGKREASNDSVTYLHQGIAQRAFKLSFR